MSAIEWTDETWNPVTGCDRVSPGCAHCYALTLAARLKAMGQPRYQRDGDPKTSGPGFGVTLHEDLLDVPLRWRRPRMVFVNSMSDLFHEEIPDWFVYRVFAAMALAREHTFQVLTKRPERAKALLADADAHDLIEQHVDDLADEINLRKLKSQAYWRLSRARSAWLPFAPDPLPNVWLGVSIENARFTWRADVLREIPSAVRFISAEPLLGSLFGDETKAQRRRRREGSAELVRGLIEEGHEPDDSSRYVREVESRLVSRHKRSLDLAGIDWLIAGGESGGRFARPMHPEWARELRNAALSGQCHHAGEEPCDDCVAARPAFFFKQWGSWSPDIWKPGDRFSERDCRAFTDGGVNTWMRYRGAGPKSGGRLLDGREWNELPPARELVAA